MKFSILAVAAILSTGAHAQGDCVACPNGISVDPSLPTSGSNTCGGISAAAANYSADSPTCAAIKAYESTCCPSGGAATTAAATTEAPKTTAAATTEAPKTTAAPMTTAAPAAMCEACPDGITVDGSTETQGGNTCEGISDAASQFTADDPTCARIQAFESVCCPSGGAATTAAATTEAPKTTAAPVTTVAAVTTAAATTAAPALTCEACPNGITVDGSTETQGGNTCATITADAAGFTADSTTCGRIQAFESICCPSGGAATTAAATTEAPKTTAAATTEAPKTTAAATTEATAAPDTTASTEETTTTTTSTAAAVGSTTSTAAPAASTTTSVPVASGFNAIYNDSAGHSFSAKNGFTLASIVVCVVSAMFM